MKTPNRLTLLLFSLLLIALACNLPSLDLPDEGVSGTDCGAPEFVVNATPDIVDGACDENCSLREAIIAANACAGENTIRLSAGTLYPLTATGTGDELGDLNITDDLIILGADPETTIIDGSTSFRIIDIAEGATVRIQDLTIQDGGANGDGGAIRSAGNLTLENLLLTDNTATGNGGAIANTGTLTLQDVTIEKNNGARGGGIFNTGQVTLTNTTISGNNATVDFTGLIPEDENDVPKVFSPHPNNFADCGGGISNQGSMTISGGLITLNAAPVGGGVCNSPTGTMSISGTEISFNPRNEIINLGEGGVRNGGGVANFGSLTLNNVEIFNNSAWNAGGILAIMLDGGSLQINDSMIDSNGAERYAAGGLSLQGGVVNIQNTQIVRNTALFAAGGIDIGRNSEYYAAPTITISHSVVAYNVAEGDYIYTSEYGGLGGGIVIYETNLTITNSTISNNQGREGGGLGIIGGQNRFEFVTIAENTATDGTGGGIFFDGGVTTFKGTLITNNTFAQCSRYDTGFSTGEIESEGYNIEGGGNLCMMRGGGHDRYSIDPAEIGLLPLTEIDGTLVHPLMPSSVAVDHVIDLEACLPDDQSGFTRPAGDGCDSGAYELDLTAMSAQIPTFELQTATPTMPGPTDQIETNDDTLCYHGPSSLYEVVDNIVPNLFVTLLGRAESQDWLVVDNPTYHVPCWMPADKLNIPTGFDLSIYPVYPDPPLPTPTPTPKPVATQPSKPNAPSKLNAKTTSCSANEYIVKLTWKDNSNNEDGFIVVRDSNLVIVLGPDSTQFIDYPSYSGPHEYVIIAVNNDGQAPSNVVQDDGCVY